MALSFMEGNEAVARGAMAAGCSFFCRVSDYPGHHGFCQYAETFTPQRRDLRAGRG